jgi:hypothetical protein
MVVVRLPKKRRKASVDTCAFLQGVAEGSTIMQRKQVEAK